MGTAYKYVEQQAEDQINWAEIGSNFSNTLKAEADLRKEKKAAIDSATREYAKVLRNVPIGENQGKNKFVQDAAADIQEMVLIQETLLKSGQLDPRQYTMIRQNMVDGTEQAFGMYESYNAQYKKLMAMKDEGLPVGEQLAGMGYFSMESVEGYGNYHNNKLVINPNTGIFSYANMIPDPNYKGSGEAPLIPDMNNLMTVESMENRTKGEILKFDVQAASDRAIDGLGEDKRKEIATLGHKFKAGIFTTVTDIKQRDGFGSYASMTDEQRTDLAARLSVESGKKVTADELKAITLFSEWQENQVEGIMAGTYAAASILDDYKGTDFDGQPYKLMENTPENLALRDAEDGTGSHIILMKNDNGRMVPDLTENQRADAKRAMKTAMNVGLDYEKDIDVHQVYRETSQAATNAGNAQIEAIKNVNLVGQLWWGNEQQIDESLESLSALNPNILDGDRNAESLIINFRDGRQKTFDYKASGADGLPLTQKQWINEVANFLLPPDHQIGNISDIFEQAGGERGRTFSEEEGYVSYNVRTEEGLSQSTLRLLEEDYPVNPRDILKAEAEATSAEATGIFVNSLPGLAGYVVDYDYDGDQKIFVRTADNVNVDWFDVEMDNYESEGDFNTQRAEFVKRMYALSASVELSTEAGQIANGIRNEGRSGSSVSKGTSRADRAKAANGGKETGKNTAKNTGGNSRL